MEKGEQIMESYYGRTLTWAVTVTLGFTLAAGSLIGSTASVAQNASSGELPKVTLQLTVPTLTHAAALTMVAKHYDRAHGIAVDMNTGGQTASLLVDIVIAGQAEFSGPGINTVLAAIRAGADLKIIGAVTNNQLAMVINNNTMKKLGVSPSAPIADRMRALKGLTIATNPVGGTYWPLLRTFLRQYGLDPDKDVKLVGVNDSNAMISGIEQGRFDAIATGSGVPEQAIALNTGTLWFSAARGDIPGAENMMISAIIVRGDTIEKHRADVDAFRAAMQDALNDVRNDHAATGRMLYKTYFPKLNPVVWDIVWNNATAAYPSTFVFPRAAFDYWVANDPKGADSYKNVDYKNVTYGPAQAP
jgi:NitT/TauT family transport system substrate-binding protein